MRNIVKTIQALGADIKALFANKADKTTTVQKGYNGTWGDTISKSLNLHNPVRLSYWDTGTQNRPEWGWGTAISISSQGHFIKQSQNWIMTLAFGTDQNLYLTQSINGGQDGWVKFYHTQNIVKEHLNVASIKTGSNSFSRKWLKISNEIMPALGSSTTIDCPIARNKIIAIHARADGESISFIQGINIQLYDGYMTLTNGTNNSQSRGVPLTIYIEYEV